MCERYVQKKYYAKKKKFPFILNIQYTLGLNEKERIEISITFNDAQVSESIGCYNFNPDWIVCLRNWIHAGVEIKNVEIYIWLSHIKHY